MFLLTLELEEKVIMAELNYSLTHKSYVINMNASSCHLKETKD